MARRRPGCTSQLRGGGQVPQAEPSGPAMHEESSHLTRPRAVRSRKGPVRTAACRREAPAQLCRTVSQVCPTSPTFSQALGQLSGHSLHSGHELAFPGCLLGGLGFRAQPRATPFLPHSSEHRRWKSPQSRGLGVPYGPADSLVHDEGAGTKDTQRPACLGRPTVRSPRSELGLLPCNPGAFPPWAAALV